MIEINKIYCESNLETMARMPDNFVDLVVTSPPYDNLRTYKDDIDKSWGEHIWKPIIKELFRVIKKGGVVVWVVNDATINVVNLAQVLDKHYGRLNVDLIYMIL